MSRSIKIYSLICYQINHNITLVKTLTERKREQKLLERIAQKKMFCEVNKNCKWF